ncbi:MAG: DNA gyrase subunit A [Acidobacteria bacterium]|nr:DNA gyrase subunit A [Acidobacteriota bacterium]
MDVIEQNIPVPVEDEVRKSYLDYAMSVIVGRALPDVRDGLKPVHRRVLFAQQQLSNNWNTAYKKSARIVGDVIGKYHPHGDQAVYDTLVRMAQDFSMRHPLVDGQGNFGSIDGDPPAAMRYTEARMTRLASELLADIDKETVDFSANYDDSMEEPDVLPAKYPNLLVNGATGIAVGMSTNIPPHNLGEIVNATIALINDKDITIDGLLKHVSGPDFPTSGIIYGAAGIVSAYKTGRGIIRMRARASTERAASGRDKDKIVLTEVPFQTNKAKLIEQIANLVKNKKIEGIADIRDESSREGIRVVIELKRGEEPDVILNNLYKQTQMTSSFGIILLAIKDGAPVVMNLKEMLSSFVEHRREVITRRTLFELKKAEARAHILEGLKIALDHLDEIIKLIRGSENSEIARTGMIAKFGMTETQAQAVLDMRLQRLTGLERKKILDDLAETLALIEELEDILASERRVLDIIIEELEEVRDAYADPRRTEIINDAQDFTVEDLIAEEDMVVTCSHAGYIKRTSLSLYRQQRRGGKGRIGAVTKEGDFVEHLFVASTHSYVMVFTEFGMAYWLKTYELPQGGPATRGKAIVNLLPRLAKGDSVATILPVEEFEDGRNILFATEQGGIKKTELTAFSHPKVTGIIAIKIQDGDRLLDAKLTDGDQDVLISTYQGKSIRFGETDARPMGRATMGVRGINLAEGDIVIGFDTIRADFGTVLTVTENGFGKRTEVADYRRQKRGGQGLIDIKTSPRNGPVVGSCVVTGEDDAMLISQSGKLIRIPTSGVKVQGRNTQGVKIIDLGDDDRVVALSRLAESEGDGDDDAEDADE